ncbi:MAG: hypothetical protein N2259_02895 [Patescibacteria group bacterium]|nr:hypothetical protein [Patescibacteria group bacterium]
MNLSQILVQEKQSLKDFFDPEFSFPPLHLSQEDFEKFDRLGFDLHFLPKIKLTQEENFFGWQEKPSPIFYQLIEKERLPKSADQLFGQWIFIERRDKPKKSCFWLTKNDLSTKILKLFKIDLKKCCQKITRQKYPDDFLEEILKKNGFSSRFTLSWQEIEEILKPEISLFLKIPPAKIRLPRFIEWNFLANYFYPQWGKTETWEWFADRLTTGECLSGGSNSLSICGWDPPDYWSTILGFRLLIEI